MRSFVQSKIFHYCEYRQFKHLTRYLNDEKQKWRLKFDYQQPYACVVKWTSSILALIHCDFSMQLTLSI